MSEVVAVVVGNQGPRGPAGAPGPGLIVATGIDGGASANSTPQDVIDGGSSA